MHRIWGTASKPPKPTLESAIKTVDTNTQRLDVKIAALNADITTENERLKKLPKGSMSERRLRESLRTKLALRQRYEGMRNAQTNQSMNMEQTQLMSDQLTGVMATVDAMKTTQKALKKQYGKIDIDKIERLQDEMADLMDMNNEIQETLSRAYDVPEEIDDEELDAELEMLGAEMEESAAADAAGVPDFMKDEVPEFIDEPPETSKKVEEAAR